jgi:hypothetical protein
MAFINSTSNVIVERYGLSNITSVPHNEFDTFKIKI